MMISVIITAYQEPKSLDKQLKKILLQLSQISPPAEVLIVTPDQPTQKVVLKYHKINNAVKLLKDRGRGKPAALNLALEKAQGDILILTDGDVEIDKRAILALLGPFQNLKIGAVSGRPVPVNKRDDLFGYWAHLLATMAHKMRIKRAKAKKPLDCSGYLYAIRARIIKKIPENTLADDALISRLIGKAGHKITYAPKAQVLVKYPDNFSDWLKQKKRSTGGYTQLSRLLKKRKLKMRGFSQEAVGIAKVLGYAQNLRELFWTWLLIFARIYLWFLIFWEIKILKKPFAQLWQRVESTKL